MSPGNLSKLAERLHVKFIGGNLCLDFANTVGGRGPRGRALREKIHGYGELLGWSRVAGTVDDGAARALARQAALRPSEAAAVHTRAILVREALHQILKCILEDRRPSTRDVDVLRAAVAVARANQRLDTRGGQFVWTFPKRTDKLDQVVWPVSLSAAELLTSGELSRLGECGGADCGWLFLDNSRGRRRRWCDMQDCGNREKVRRFRAKAR
jgi:predicted RNA-binding Zn ribbon-like protein